MSTAAVASAPAEVVCAGCGAELVATASGEAHLREEGGAPSRQREGGGVTLPGYEGGPGPVGSEPAGRLPRFLELVPAVAVPASEPAEPRAGHAGEQVGVPRSEPPRVATGPGPTDPAREASARTEPVSEATGRTEPGPDARHRAGTHGASPAAPPRRRPVAPPQGRPGEPVAILPPSAPGAHAIPVGAPSPRPSAQTSDLRSAVKPPRSGPVAHLAALGALGGALVVVGLAARWGLPPGAEPAPVAAAAANPVGPGVPASERALRHYQRANALLAADQPGEALRELQACVALAPGLGAAYRSLGIAYMRLGREASAIEAYERFVGLAPRHRDADEARRIIEAYRGRASRR